MHPYHPPSPISSTLSDNDMILPVCDIASIHACGPVSSPLLSAVVSPAPAPAPSPMASPSPSTAIDTARLWHRMLALQRRYHCYNSARVSAALEDSAVAATVPSRVCLDLLNESIDLQVLPDDVRNDVMALFQHGGSSSLDESRLAWLLAGEADDDDTDSEVSFDDNDDVISLDLGLPLVPLVPTAAALSPPPPVVVVSMAAAPVDTKEALALDELEDLEQVEHADAKPEKEAAPIPPPDDTTSTERAGFCSIAPLRKLGLRFGLRLGIRLPTWRRQRHIWRLRVQV